MALVSRGKRPPRQDEPPLSDGAWGLIQQCWVTDPPKRSRMKAVAEQMMTISQSLNEGKKKKKRKKSQTDAQNDAMMQDASLSLSTSSTTVRRMFLRRFTINILQFISTSDKETCV